jgi:hypothetical protein
MIDAAVKALSQIFSQPLRRVLLKAVGLALLLIVIMGIVMQRLLSAMVRPGPSSPRVLHRTPPGRHWPGCCRSWRRSALSPARCS